MFVFQGHATVHPFQRNSVPGPKGAFELKIIDSGLYVRVDMPGVLEGLVSVRKGANDVKNEITFKGITENMSFWPMDSSRRVYEGIITVDCDDFEKVSFTVGVKNGCCRIIVRGGGVRNGYLSYRPGMHFSIIFFCKIYLF